MDLATLAQCFRPRMVEGYTPTPETLLTPRPVQEFPVTISAGQLTRSAL